MSRYTVEGAKAKADKFASDLSAFVPPYIAAGMSPKAVRDQVARRSLFDDSGLHSISHQRIALIAATSATPNQHLNPVTTLDQSAHSQAPTRQRRIHGLGGGADAPQTA